MRNSRKDYFAGKNVLITGGSSGIGLALARALAARGANLWLVARNQSKLEAVCKELSAGGAPAGQKVGFTVADIANEAQACAAVAEAGQALGSLDVVINNAGVTHPGYFQDIPAQTFREMMDTNYFGTLYITRAVVPDMILRKNGCILNISSLVAILAVYGYSAYAASKWAVRGFTDVLRSEMKPRGIRVSIAFPPDTDTPQLAFEDPIKPAETKIIASNNKVYAPEQVARDILAGVEHNRYLIFTGGDSIFYYWLANLLGPLQYAVMDLFVADAIRKRAAKSKNP